MPKIFISYRRADSEIITGRIYDRLEYAFGAAAVFKDVDNIPPGVDFRKVMSEAIDECDVLLAIIGPEWLDIRDADGKRRLDDPNDFVRFEIESALQNPRVLTVPVLVKDAQPPSAAALPPSFQQLAFHHAVKIRNDPDFRRDCDWLIDYISKIDREKELPRRVNQGQTSPAESAAKPAQTGATLVFGGRNCNVQLSVMVGALLTFFVVGFLLLNMDENAAENLDSGTSSALLQTDTDTESVHTAMPTTAQTNVTRAVTSTVSPTQNRTTTAATDPTPAQIPTRTAAEQDLDRDSLSFEQESALGTDPTLYDTDGDGLSDAAEVSSQYNSDPLQPDTDGDGRADGDEIEIYNSDPTVPDVFATLDVATIALDPQLDVVSETIEMSTGYLLSERATTALTGGDVALSVSERFLAMLISQRLDGRGVAALGPIDSTDIRTLDPFSVPLTAFERMVPALAGQTYIVRLRDTPQLRAVLRVDEVSGATLRFHYVLIAATE